MNPLPCSKGPVFDGAFFVRSLLHAFEEDFPAENLLQGMLSECISQTRRRLKATG